LLAAAVDTDGFRLVLLDMQMPEMSGAEVAARIRGDARLGDVRLVLLSSMGSLPGGVQAARALGFDGALAKPVPALDALRHGRDGARLGGVDAAAGASVALAPDAPRVLVVTETAVEREILVQMLGRLGCRAEGIADADGARAAASPGRYDLAVVDLDMRDGLATAAAIRAGHGAERVVGCGVDDRLRGERAAAGLAGYVVKPVQLADLAQILARPGRRAASSGPPEAKTSPDAGVARPTDSARRRCRCAQLLARSRSKGFVVCAQISNEWTPALAVHTRAKRTVFLVSSRTSSKPSPAIGVPASMLIVVVTFGMVTDPTFFSAARNDMGRPSRARPSFT
jgi:CheY-like chemotaxis protein